MYKVKCVYEDTQAYSRHYKMLMFLHKVCLYHQQIKIQSANDFKVIWL